MKPHGTIGRYATGRGCHCPSCRAANAAYQRDWRKRHPDQAKAIASRAYQKRAQGGTR